jgi:putative tricarboxylic transport membrane protein
VLLLMPAGFIIAATVLFVLVARAFSSRRMLRDAVAGLLLALIVYFSFTAGLGLVLPKGILAGLI